MGTAGYDVEVFYDGDCPLCMREIRLLRRLDARRGRIRFTDIAAPDFEPEALGIDWGTFMAKIHARLPDGSWLTGVEVFRRLYAAVGLGPLVWLTRAPGVSQLLELAYAKFAANRLKWTGRCDGECELPPRRLAA
jgi:predicted DCC family thiol-disulfide oxidoreductase YuxK